MEKAAASGKYHIVLSGQQAFCERLILAAKPRHQPQRCPEQSVLVTGGTRGLGLEFAKEKLQRGAKVAVLLSRHALLTKDQLMELAGGNKAVFTMSCDSSCVAALTEVVAWARQWLPPIQVYPVPYLVT